MDIVYLSLIGKLFLGFLVLGALALSMIYFSNRHERKIAAGDVKAASRIAWIVTSFPILFAVLGVRGLIQHADMPAEMAVLGMLAGSALQSGYYWRCVRQMRDAGQKGPEYPGPTSG